MPTSAPEPPPEDAARPRRRKKSSRRRGFHDEDEPVRYTVSDVEPEVAAEESAEPPAIAPERFPHDLDDGRIDPDAAKVVRRLTRHGYEAYLVGGCVRDLLLGRSMAEVKDFDVATSARPEVVRDLFRNCRIIGRRFRLAHVLYGNGKVIETATFRRNPSEVEKSGDDLLIRDDNVFGRAHEDAQRRDFTINALFYDLEAREVLDWCQGMADIRQRSVRTIGDPVIRFKEDPVRMLRAVKFSARLDLGIDPATYEAIVQCRNTLAQAARPRLFEEVLRLMRGGAAHRSMWLAWELGLLDILLPELATYLYDLGDADDRPWRLLDQVDWLVTHSKEPVDDIVLLSLLLYEPLMEACDGQRDRITAAHEFLEPLVERLAMPRRIADAIRRIVAILPRLMQGRAPKFQKTPLAGVAEQVLQCVQSASSSTSPANLRILASEAGAGGSKRRRRSRRGGSKAAGAPSAVESAD